MIHTLLIVALLYAVVRAALRGRKPDPMAGRLVSGSAQVRADAIAWHKQQHDTFAERHSWDRMMKRVEDERERERAAKVSAPVDHLAGYRPKLET